MGCCSSTSSQAEQGKVPQLRRRLSVGGVDEKEQDSGSATDEEDRGLIAKLNQESLIELLGATDDRKFSLGSQTDQGKTSFAVKSVQQLGEKVDTTSLGLGHTCRKGLKPESPNQDSWSVMQVDGDFAIYGVYDGHGQRGHDVSNFVKDNLPKLILRDQRWKTADMLPMLSDCFKRTQSLVSAADRMKKLSAKMSGTTASVVIHNYKESKLFVAHVADSTVVLGSYKGGKWQGIALTRDHKPNLSDEKARIEKAGGRVVFDGYANHRVYAKNGRYPGLNMSRCLGDLMGHQDAGCSCEPEVNEVPLKPEDRVLLVCSDGVWEFISPEEAVLMVGDMSNNPQQAADKLAKEAWDRWIREEGGAVVDDITAILIYLKPNNA
jgi:serine/threonine protein phosphatase PrpC